MIGDGLVSAGKGHVAFLSLAEISQRPVLGPLIGIPVSAARRSGKGENQGISPWRADASLHLAAVFRVNIPALIRAPDLEISDRHVRVSFFRHYTTGYDRRPDG
jgi:hypothetical protein